MCLYLYVSSSYFVTKDPPVFLWWDFCVVYECLCACVLEHVRSRICVGKKWQKPVCICLLSTVSHPQIMINCRYQAFSQKYSLVYPQLWFVLSLNTKKDTNPVHTLMATFPKPHSAKVCFCSGFSQPFFLIFVTRLFYNIICSIAAQLTPLTA